MNQRYAAIRFVGGPWHNRIVDVALLSVIHVPADYDREAAMLRDPIPPRPRHHNYHLYNFEQRLLPNRPPIQFLQYVHQSLMPFEGYREHESFPPLPDDLVNEHLGKLAFLRDVIYAR